MKHRLSLAFLAIATIILFQADFVRAKTNAAITIILSVDAIQSGFRVNMGRRVRSSILPV